MITMNQKRLMDLLIAFQMTADQCVGIIVLAETDECMEDMIHQLEQMRGQDLTQQQIMNICGQVIEEHQ